MPRRAMRLQEDRLMSRRRHQAKQEGLSTRLEAYQQVKRQKTKHLGDDGKLVSKGGYDDNIHMQVTFEGRKSPDILETGCIKNHQP